MKTILFFFVLMSVSFFSNGQCTILANATASSVTLTCTGGTVNRSGLAFNPNANLYYSVNAGSSAYNIETFSQTGTPLNSVVAGFDYRGAWWNSNTNAFEGNGYFNSGVFVHNLNATTSYPLGSGTTLFSGWTQPDPQSCGTYNPITNEIIFYFGGNIHRYNRTSGILIGTIPVSGLPVSTSNLNSSSIAYTGCSGKEVVLYDYVLFRVYFINLTTGAYVGMSQLPNTAPAATLVKMSFANELFWLYNGTAWQSYSVLNYCPASFSTIAPTACNTYTSPSGNYTYTSSGTYSDTLQNSQGCDSIITINLTVNTVNSNVTQSGLILFASASGATYQWLDCLNNFAAIPNETSQGYIVTANGSYAVKVTQNGCTDTSNCIVVANVSLDELGLNQDLIVYPNPTKDNFSIKLVQQNIEKVEFFDAFGRKMNIKFDATLGQVDVSDLANGSYFLVVSSSTQQYKKKINILK